MRLAVDDLAARLSRLSGAELEAMHEAAAEAARCLARLAARGLNPVTQAIGAAERVEEWAHFPPGDVVDPATHSQYYYHSHSAEERVEGEHGHFHTFVRAQALSDLASTAAEAASSPTHLIGISTGAAGGLIRLFTTNRWVTGETWFEAATVCRMLERFEITPAGPLGDLNGWITAIVRMFRPQIVDLVRARDAHIAAFAAAHPGGDVFEERALQVTSERAVDFLAQIEAIETAIAALS